MRLVQMDKFYFNVIISDSYCQNDIKQPLFRFRNFPGNHWPKFPIGKHPSPGTNTIKLF